MLALVYATDEKAADRGETFAVDVMRKYLFQPVGEAAAGNAL